MWIPAVLYTSLYLFTTTTSSVKHTPNTFAFSNSHRQRMSRECLKDVGILGCPHRLLPLTFLYCGHFIGRCFYLLRHRQTCSFKIQRCVRSAKSRTVTSLYFLLFESQSLTSKLLSTSRKASSLPVCLLM